MFAAIIELDADIEAGSLPYRTSLAVVDYFRSVGIELPIEQRKSIWAALKQKAYAFDEHEHRTAEYTRIAATALWNKFRQRLPDAGLYLGLIRELGLEDCIEI